MNVPEEFIPQSLNHANPPTFLLVVKELLSNEHQDGDFLAKIMPRVELWYQWLLQTQRSSQSSVVTSPQDLYWVGRSENKNGRELNPKTLTSGLDDYPRASHPDNSELHIDIRSWLAVGANVMKFLHISHRQQKELPYDPINDKSHYYSGIYEKLSDMNDIVNAHWSYDDKMFADFGFHSKNVELYSFETYDKNTRRMERKWKRKVKSKPEHQLVTDAYGYNSLFPFFLELMDPYRDEFMETLKKMKDPKAGIWTKYGLRSLSNKSPYYEKRNTEHDPGYWRGKIWININYMVIKALKNYSTHGPETTRSECYKLYRALKKNVFSTVYDEWVRTGYFWEQYSDVDGQGHGTRSFSGWTTLAILLAD